jgi:hypothetical protein
MRKIILFIFFGFLFYTVKSQSSTNELPYSWEIGRGEISISSIPIINMPNLDLKALSREDLRNEGTGTPYRFGFSHDVLLSLTNSGVWQTTKDGGRLWTLRIYSPDALSLNLLYDKFWIPNGAQFFLYSEDMKQHIGAFTSKNNKGDRENILGFATSFLFTNSIVLEYYEPAETIENGIISISNVISGYRSLIQRQEEPPGGDPPSPCYFNVNCRLFDDWKEEKNAVALMIMREYACSGALLNTTANDRTPVFLSANHCFVDDVSTHQWVFYWNYENPNNECDYLTHILYPNKSTCGANLLAKRADTDFMLLNLAEDDPALHQNVTVYYLGWDRDTDPYPAGEESVCIHHPEWQSKAIAITQNAIVNYPNSLSWGDEYGNIIDISPPDTHWDVNFTKGSVYFGSSGSPILRPNKRVIGQLHGGSSAVCVPPLNPRYHNYYGRFDLSWDSDTSNTRLKDWLDPLNTDELFVDGFSCTKNLVNQTIATNKTIIGCDILNVENVIISNNAIVNITASQKIIIQPNFHAMSGTNVWIRIEESGKQTSSFSLPATNETSSASYHSQSLASNIITAKNSFSFYPNPNNGTFQLEANFPLTDISHFKITNLLGITVYETKNLASNIIQLQNSAQGLYFVVLILQDGSVLTQKMVVQR